MSLKQLKPTSPGTRFRRAPEYPELSGKGNKPLAPRTGRRVGRRAEHRPHFAQDAGIHPVGFGQAAARLGEGHVPLPEELAHRLRVEPEGQLGQVVIRSGRADLKDLATLPGLFIGDAIGEDDDIA